MTPEDIFNAAADAGREMQLPYAGALPPDMAHQLAQSGAAAIVDVRTAAELAFVGRIPDATAIEWQSFPDMSVNDGFLAQLQSEIPVGTPVLFVCRSGARSHHAATVAAEAGYRAYNVLEGFEGDLDSDKHRNTVNGWRARGLPWIQS